MNTRASVLMMPLSTVYRAVTQARLAAYRTGLFRTSTLNAPVISVGNITTGGTGKTPLVEWVCRVLAERPGGELKGSSPKSICVLTRGYGKVNPKEQVLVSNRHEVLVSEREAGDEPLLLAKNLLGVASVISNPDRVAAGEWAIRELGSDVFVLDDGFQHLRLARNLDIVTIDATNPLGGGELLPHGRLREAAHNLARADCVVITRADQASDLVAVKNAVRQFVDDRPVFISRMLTAGFRGLMGEVIDQTEILKQPAGAFCGVGNPDSFFTQVRNTGVELAFSRAFPDHHRYSPDDIEQLVKQAQAKGATCLFTTAKDATKLSAAKWSIPCYVLEVKIVIDDEVRLATMIRAAAAKASLPK